MIIHIGWDKCVHTEDVVALLNADAAQAPDTAAFLAHAQKAGQYSGCDEGIRSYAVLKHGIEACAINTATLLKRFQKNGIYDIEENEIYFTGGKDYHT